MWIFLAAIGLFAPSVPIGPRLRPRDAAEVSRVAAETRLRAASNSDHATTGSADSFAQRGSVSPRDSAAAHRMARRAQADFESRRRHLLPQTFGGSGGRCDVRIGRFCYWHDGGEVTPPPEPPAIGRARRELIARLDSAGEAVPGDAWVAGQRVRYLVEAGRESEAVHAAGACGAEAWWCAALAGFAYHAAGDARDADSAFAVALSSMPNEQRCAWEDVGPLLPPRAAARHRRLSCDERRPFANAFWWLAQPLWSVEGNDRRTEHYSRHVMSRLERESRSPYDMQWGGDSHELVVRYGWPTRWSRDARSSVDPSAIRVVGHEPSPAFDFVPDDSTVAQPLAARADAWEFRRPEPASRYAPRYARAFVALHAHVARFARGDSMLIVAVGELYGDTVLRRDSLDVALVGATGPAAPRSVAHSASHGPRFPAALTVGAESMLVSLEVRDSARREVGRARLALRPPDRTDASVIRLSDLLLFVEPSADDAAIEQILPRVTTASAIPQGSRIGVYWELDGDGPRADTVTYTITVTPSAPGLLRRMASKLGWAANAAPVHMSFTEPTDAGRPTTRVLTVDLATLTRGQYELRVRAESGAGAAGESSRAIHIERRP